MSGNGAAEKIQKLPGVSKAVLQAHNNAALEAITFMEITGLLAWLGLWQYRRFGNARRWTSASVLVLAAISVYLMGVAGSTNRRDTAHRDPHGAAGRETGGDPVRFDGCAQRSGEFVSAHQWMWPTCETPLRPVRS